MPTDRIILEHSMEAADYTAIDRFAGTCQGEASLPELARFLAERFGIELVLDSDIVAGFLQDSSNLPGKASALCRPQSTREWAAVFQACFRAGLPFTVSAGRSNLTGSATPLSGVLMSTVRMTAPVPSVCESAMTVRAPVGMIVEDLRRAVLAQTGGRLMFPVDPTSRADASVGGAIACNASGFTPGAIGAMRHWVESVDFLLPDGAIVRADRGQYVSSDGAFVLGRDGVQTPLPVPRHRRPALKNASGPFSAPDGQMDFVDLVVGSEGIFGAVTACTLRLARRPAACLDLFFSLPAEADALRLRDRLAATLDGGLGSLSALEYFGANCRRYMDHEERLFHGTHQVAVYIQVPLADANTDDAAADWLRRLAAAQCGVEPDRILLLDNERDRTIFLEARHSLPANSLEVVQRRRTYTIMTDTVVPPERFAEFLADTQGLICSAGLEYLSFGHLGDCHLHFTILPEREQLARAVAVYDAIIQRSAELGGIYSGEHGTGKRKRADFLRCFGSDAVAGIRRTKAAVDPAFLLNRGNVIAAEGAPA